MHITPKLVEELDSKLTSELRPDQRLGLVRRYLAGDHDLPYMPRKAKPEYRQIAASARLNLLPRVVGEFVKALAVDGFRARGGGDNLAAWSYWQDNGLDARQTITHRGALEYGVSYVLVLPGTSFARPVIKPLSPLRSAAWYSDPDDDYPEVAIERLGEFREADTKRQLVAVYDATRRIIYSRPSEGGDMRFEREEVHGLGVVPFVRFRDRLDSEALGLVRPFKLHQDRINSVLFSIAIALQFAMFRQRWATGLQIPEDDEGNPVEPFQAAIDRLWVTDDPNAKFGEFQQTVLQDHHAELAAAVAALAAAADVSPTVLSGGGSVANVSAEALRLIQGGTNRKLDEYKLLFGESWELVFRLAARAAGQAEPDRSAEVRWRDVGGESLAAKVDALVKLRAGLDIPGEALWDEVPGVTDTKLQRWREASDRAVEADPLGALAASLRTPASTPTELIA